jgi:hypothetical protein
MKQVEGAHESTVPQWDQVPKFHKKTLRAASEPRGSLHATRRSKGSIANTTEQACSSKLMKSLALDGRTTK